MTAAVSNAALGVADVAQSGGAKAGAIGYRNRAKQLDEGKSESDNADVISPGGQVDMADARTEKAEKQSTPGSAKTKSGDRDASFEDTFDSIGQDAPQDVGQKPDPTLISLPILIASPATGAEPTARLPEKSETTIPQFDGPVRPGLLLRKNSILALMNAKDQFFGNADDVSMKATRTPQDQMLNSESATNVTQVTVDRSETHWNFVNQPVMKATSQGMALQTPSTTVQQAEAVVEAPAASASSAQAQLRVTNPATAQQTPAPAPQTIAMPTSGGSGNSPFNTNSEGDPGNAESKNQASTASKDGKIAKTDLVDKIFVSSNPQGNSASVSDQVRSGVIDSLAGAKVEATAGTSGAVLPTRPAATPVLRTLDLTLSPEDMGSVRLRMSLKSNSLTIEAEASKASTAKLLNDDRMSLEHGLRDAGYDVSSLKISDVSASGSSNSSGWLTNGSPAREGDQARSGFTSQQDGQMQRRDGSTSDQASRRQKDERPQSASGEPTGGRTGDAVYI